MEVLNNTKLYRAILQFSTVALTLSLFWLAFFYYPKTVKDIKTGKTLSRITFLKPVTANTTNFPITTEAYNIEYEDKSQTYYSFIEGTTLSQFVFNRDNAVLALRTALSVQNLCTVNVIFVSAQELDVPQNFTGNTDC